MLLIKDLRAPQQWPFIVRNVIRRGECNCQVATAVPTVRSRAREAQWNAPGKATKLTSV